MSNFYYNQLHAHLETEDNRAEWKHGRNAHRSLTCIRDSSFNQKWSSEVKEIELLARLLLHIELCDVRCAVTPFLGLVTELVLLVRRGQGLLLTHLRPLALPLGSSLPLTPWLRIIADRDGEWELDAAAATSSPKPSSADIFLLCCEGKWEKTNIHNERNNKLSVGVCRKAKYTDFYLKILHAAGDWGVLQSRKGWKWLHFKCCPRIFALWPDLNGIQHHWNTNTWIQ